jgi:hypothetical protein
VIAAGFAHVIAGVARFTTNVTVAVAGALSVESVGVKVTLRVCDPAPNTVPVAGE